MPAEVRNVNIGTHRGKPRLWLEGTWLPRVGFQRGARYTAKFTPERIVLKVEAAGTRTVSGKVKNGREVGVIDINSHDVPFTGAVTVRPSLAGGVIYIQREGK